MAVEQSIARALAEMSDTRAAVGALVRSWVDLREASRPGVDPHPSDWVVAVEWAFGAIEARAEAVELAVRAQLS